MRSRFITVLALTVLLASVIGVANANHHDYLAEDPFSQKDWIERTENYANVTWAITDTGDITWWADPEIHSDVWWAIWRWSEHEQRLDWLEVSDETQADVVFLWVPEVPPAAIEWRIWHSDPYSDANYWQAADVRVNSNQNWGTGGRIAAISHEIGHLYGLHERYLDSNGASGCNEDEEVIMDGGKLEDPEDPESPLVHCDGELVGPQPKDIERVQAFWHTGTLSSFGAVKIDDTIGRYTYKDDSWAEFDHLQG